MKTKIVYVVASLSADIYMEQAIASAWSARYYNPDCRIEMVCDQDTFATLDSGIRLHYKLGCPVCCSPKNDTGNARLMLK